MEILYNPSPNYFYLTKRCEEDELYNRYACCDIAIKLVNGIYLCEKHANIIKQVIDILGVEKIEHEIWFKNIAGCSSGS